MSPSKNCWKNKRSGGISAWPQEDRPREKLASRGERALTDSELLAIILRTGARGVSALDLSRSILRKFGRFRRMSSVDVLEWRGIKGLGAAKIAQIKAALEIGRRCAADKEKDDRLKITCSGDAADALMPIMRDMNREIFKTLLLNTQNRLIEITDVEDGTVNEAYPIIREIFRKALHKDAAFIICVHNHPGGNPQPSPQDCVFTQQLSQVGKALGVEILDHVIIGGEGYFSFADEGKL